jgi:hypothetical protein
MRLAVEFVVRLVLVGIGVGLALVIAGVEWNSLGLDAIANGAGPAAARILRWRDRLPVVVALATLLLAALGGRARLVAIFLFWAFVALIVTAPFAISRAVGV